jgi:hypothetical protein
MLPPIGANPPPFLNGLLDGHTAESKEFFKSIRNYNNAFSFVSLGVRDEDRSVEGQQGVYTFRVNGEFNHRIGGLLPEAGATPCFAQIYTCDTTAAIG